MSPDRVLLAQLAEHRWRTTLLAFALSCVIAGSFLFSVFLTSDRMAHNCHQIENLKAAVRDAIDIQVSELGQPGQSGYSYYRQHPAELEAARSAALAQKAEFAAGKC